MKQFGISVHGGAGTILKSLMTPEKESSYRNSISESIRQGSYILRSGGSSIDAVIKAITILEDDPNFNAGKGSVFTNEGKHSMDASIMNGNDLSAGSVASICGVRNPILLAKAVLDVKDLVLINGNGAIEFAKEKGLKFEDDEYFYNQHRYDQYLKALKKGKAQLDHTEDEITDKKFGTVGAVALDTNGNLAAATSTGGMTNVKFGRIGDSPVIGAGTYANNNTCAVSCTGDGEFFLRSVTAFDVSAVMEYKLLTLKEACKEVVHKKLISIGGEGGLIAIDKDCNIEMVFNSKGMYRGFCKNDGELVVKIYND